MIANRYATRALRQNYQSLRQSSQGATRNYQAKRYFLLPSLPDFLNSDDAIEYSQTKDLPYTKKQLYEIVKDVDNYFHFVPFCTYSKVLKRGQSTLDARLGIGFKGYNEKYMSKVTLKPFDSVTAIGQSPMFKELITAWHFDEKRANVTTVHFSVSFSFSNPVYRGVAQAAFGPVSELMIQAFQQRCEKIYGKKSSSL